MMPPTPDDFDWESSEWHAVEAELLRICNFSTSTLQLMRELSAYFQRITGCEAIGVRLNKDGDFPYYETRGFSEDFVKIENSLCARDLNGQLLRDEIGHPILECMCGNVLCGRFDPARPFFTPHGSFWSSCTSELLANTTPVERLAHTRNRCNGEGYESVALVPLRLQNKTFGLFQFNDHRRGRFTRERIEQFERLVDYVAIALSNQEAVAALRESEERYRRLADNLPDVVFRYNLAPRPALVYISPAIAAMSGYTQQECYADPQCFPGLAHPADTAQMDLILRGNVVANTPIEMRWVDRNRMSHWVEIRTVPVSDPQGETIAVEGIAREISEHKRVEDTLLFLAQRGYDSAENFFQALARFLSEALEMDYARIDRLEKGSLAVRAMAIYFRGQIQDNAHSPVPDPPDDLAFEQNICYPQKAWANFPQNRLFREIEAESCLGTILRSTQGQPVGRIVVIGRRPLTHPRLAATVLKLTAARAAGELERGQGQELLNEQLIELRRWYAITLGRENRILELKNEVNQLLTQAGQFPRYASSQEAARE